MVLSAVEEALVKIMWLVEMYGVTKTLWLVVTPVAVQVATAVELAVTVPMVTVQVPNCISATVSPTLLIFTLSNDARPVEEAVAKFTAPVVVRFSSPKLIAPVSELIVGNLTVPVEDAVVRTRLPVSVVTPVTPKVETSVRAPVDEKEEVAVAPKYALLNTESCVEEALPNVESPVTDTVPSVLMLVPMVVAA